MPRRPTKKWWRECTSAVASSGSAVDPSRVCGATWARKSASQKRATIARTERGSMPGHFVRGKR